MEYSLASRGITTRKEGRLAFHHCLVTPRFGTGVADGVPLAIEASDEQWASVHLAAGLIGRNDRRLISFRSGVSYPFSEAAAAEFLGAAEEVDGVIGVKGSDAGLHGAIVLLAEG